LEIIHFWKINAVLTTQSAVAC